MAPIPRFGGPARHAPGTLALSRRTLLRGAAALGATGAVGALGGFGLSGCGGDDEPKASGNGKNVPAPVAALLQLTDSKSTLAAGSAVRLPLGLADAKGIPVTKAPESLMFDVETVDGESVATGLTVDRHAQGLPRAYFPLVFTPKAPGAYRAVTDFAGVHLDTAFEVSKADDIVIPRPGQPFPSITTPTDKAPDGVDPICTQDPPCPLHEAELTSVLGSKPTALLVSTPAFCQSAICGPVLDLLLDATKSRPSITFIHAEVYKSGEEAEKQGPGATLAPAVEALKLTFEPCLFVIGPDGVLVRRVDAVFDAKELSDALAELT